MANILVSIPNERVTTNGNNSGESGRFSANSCTQLVLDEETPFTIRGGAVVIKFAFNAAFVHCNSFDN